MNRFIFTLLYFLQKKIFIIRYRQYRNYLELVHNNDIISNVIPFKYKENININSIIYKNNEWNHIKYISKIMWNDLYKCTFFQYKKNKPDFYIDNDCNEFNTIKREINTIKCYSQGKDNDWIFLRIPLNEIKDYCFEFDTCPKTENTEFQIAFNYQSIGKRFRFNVTNNKTLDFDIVNNGFFLNKIFSIPFSFNIGINYHIKLFKLNDNVRYIVNGTTIMQVNFKKHIIENGDIVLILWDSKNSNINVIYSNLTLHY